jgi:hypothetical protein
VGSTVALFRSRALTAQDVPNELVVAGEPPSVFHLWGSGPGEQVVERIAIPAAAGGIPGHVGGLETDRREAGLGEVDPAGVVAV